MYDFFCKYVKKATFKIILLCILGVGSSICGVRMAVVSKDVVDAATGVSGGSFLSEGIKLCVLLILLLVFQIGTSVVHVRCSAGLKKDIQKSFFEQLLHKDRLSVSAFHSGELVNRLAGDVTACAEGAAEIIPAVLSLSARVILSFIALAVLDLPLALICLGLGPVMLIMAKIYRDKTSHFFLDAREAEGETRSYMQEAFQNLSVIKAFTAFDIITNQLQTRQKRTYGLTVKKNTIGICANICFFTAMTAGYYAALAWGAYRLRTGVISFGTMTALLTLSGELTSPFQSLASLFSQIMSVSASVKRLSELEKLPGEVLSLSEDCLLTYRDLEGIAMRDISFSYGENLVLSGFSAEFKKGSLTAVTGSSGIGKSTVLGLLAGLYKQQQGDVLLVSSNGKETVLDEGFAKMFAYVPQDILILSGTIRDNITFFAENVDEEKLDRAVSVSCLLDDLSKMQDGINTLLGENGSRLSGGQRQRIALARAFYSDAKILLLDEATSALSQEMEEEVIRNIKRESYTAIIVTHRRSVVDLCENILNVKDGTLMKNETKQK